MGEKIQSIINNPTPGQQTLEEGLGALGLLGGSYLANRQGRASAYGAPLQLLGSGLLGSGLYGGAKRDEAKRLEDLSNFVTNAKSGGTGPDLPESQFIGGLIKRGETPNEAISTAKSLYTPPKDQEGTPIRMSDSGGPFLFFPNSGRREYIGKDANFYEKATQKKDDIYDITAKELGLTVPREKWGISEWGAIRNKISEDRKAGQKDTSVNLSFGGYGIGPDGKPVAIERNPKTGGISVGALPEGVTPLGMVPKPKGSVEIKTTANINGSPYDYKLTHKQGDPLFGIAKATSNTLLSKVGGKGIPQFMWRINGKYVDPKTLSKDDLKKNAKLLTDRGFTLEEIMPSGG